MLKAIYRNSEYIWFYNKKALECYQIVNKKEFLNAGKDSYDSMYTILILCPMFLLLFCLNQFVFLYPLLSLCGFSLIGLIMAKLAYYFILKITMRTLQRVQLQPIPIREARKMRENIIFITVVIFLFMLLFLALYLLLGANHRFVLGVCFSIACFSFILMLEANSFKKWERSRT